MLLLSLAVATDTLILPLRVVASNKLQFVLLDIQVLLALNLTEILLIISDNTEEPLRLKLQALAKTLLSLCNHVILISVMVDLSWEHWL